MKISLLLVALTLLATSMVQATDNESAGKWTKSVIEDRAFYVAMSELTFFCPLVFPDVGNLRALRVKRTKKPKPPKKTKAPKPPKKPKAPKRTKKPKPPKVKLDICHYSKDTGLFKLQNLPEKAANKHMKKHGDVLAPAEGVIEEISAPGTDDGSTLCLDDACGIVDCPTLPVSTVEPTSRRRLRL